MIFITGLFGISFFHFLHVTKKRRKTARNCNVFLKNKVGSANGYGNFKYVAFIYHSWPLSFQHNYCLVHYCFRFVFCWTEILKLYFIKIIYSSPPNMDKLRTTTINKNKIHFSIEYIHHLAAFIVLTTQVYIFVLSIYRYRILKI